VVQRLLERLERETPAPEAARLATAAFVLTGLRLPRAEALGLFQGVRAMRDSTTYQFILDEGRAEEARRFLFLQGRAKFGSPDAAAETALQGINDLERLEQMGERLLTAASWQELLAEP
jgi:hypothetical protein